jgi:hypothetical protein
MHSVSASSPRRHQPLHTTTGAAMKSLQSLLATLVCLVLLGTSAWGQASLTGIGTPYNQSFDAIGTGSITPWSDNVTLLGWYVKRTTGANNVNVGDGSSNAGGLYNFGLTSDPNRALGALGSGSTGTIYYAVRLRNNTSQTITAVAVSYFGEQWRYSGTAAAQDLTVSYLVGTVDSLNGGSWTSVPALTFTSPIISGTAGALNGNLPANRASLSTTIGATLAVGADIWIRWVEVDHSGSDHGLATDDLTITPLAPAITNFYSKPSGNLEVLANWGTNPDGSGTAPANFTSAYQSFNIRNGSSFTIGGAWTVSGLLSKIVVGNGTDACSFTVPSGFAVVGAIDVASNATLTLQNHAKPSLGSLAAGSTVNYSQSGTDTVVIASYSNLTLTGGTKLFAAGSTNVQGNLLVDGVSALSGVGSPFSTVNLNGNFTLQNGATFSSADTSRFTLVVSGSTVQTFNGNGSEFKLFKLTSNNAAGVVLASGSSNLTLGNPSGGGLDINAGTLSVNSNTLQTFNGRTFITMAGTVTATASSNFVFNQSNSSSSGFGTLRMTPGSETINNLTVNLSDSSKYGTLKLGTNLTVAGTLSLINGTVKPGVNTFAVTGTVTRTSGRVWGKLQKPIPTGATSRTFEIGDSLVYTPVAVAFGNVTAQGNLAVSDTAGDHPNLATSGLDVTKKLNRYYTLTNSGVAFNNCNVTFTFVASDVDAGANTSNFVVKKFDLGTWTSPTTASPLATSIQATGITSFSDFAIGEATGGGSGQTVTSMNSAWNIVSVPRVAPDFTASVLFPGAIPGTINSFITGAYTQPTTLVNGEGYWAYYGAAGNNTISGTNLASTSVTVSTGNRWVLVGSVTATVAASALTSNPPSAIVGGTLFGWNGTAYSAPTTLDPGKGYWVFVNAPCTLTISSAAAPAKPAVSPKSVKPSEDVQPGKPPVPPANQNSDTN